MLKVTYGDRGDGVQEVIVLTEDLGVGFESNKMDCTGWYKCSQVGI